MAHSDSVSAREGPAGNGATPGPSAPRPYSTPRLVALGRALDLVQGGPTGMLSDMWGLFSR